MHFVLSVCVVFSRRGHDKMAKAAVAKLLILAVLIIIICIPEFFLSHRGSRVDFLCVPCLPAEECGWLKKRHVAESGGEKRREGACDPCLALGSDQPRPAPVCAAGYQANRTDPGSDPGTTFMCETDMDEAYFRDSGFMSDSPEGLEVWMEVQLEETVHLNLVLYDQRNTSSLYLHPPAEPEEEADDRQKAFYCCLPPPPVPQPTNHSRCLVQLANQSALSAAEALPWERTGKRDEWQRVFKALWLTLTGVVLLLVLTSLLAKVCRKRGKTKGGPLCGSYKGSHLSGSCPLVDTSSGIVLSSLGLPHWTVLSPIQEDESPIWEVVPNTLLDGNVEPSGSCTAHLHHRGHPSLSSISEEQAL